MRWEHLSSPEFAAAVKSCRGVGALPIGVLEAHGPHLPLGVDMLDAHWTAVEAAKIEPVVVHPAFPFSINHESAHLPGALALSRDLCFRLLEGVCSEFARNGLRRIVLLSSHGGNRFFLPLFVQTWNERPRDAAVIWADLPQFVEPDVLESAPEEIGHACEAETSTSLHILPELTRPQAAPPEPGRDRGRLAALRAAGGYSSADWFAQFPSMYVGEARRASAEKGRAMAEARVARLARLLRAVKEADDLPALLAELAAGRAAPSAPASWAG